MPSKQAHRRESARLREIEARRDAALAERGLIEVQAIENIVRHQRQEVAAEALSLMGSVFVDRRDYLPIGWGFDAARQFGTSIFSSMTDRQDGRNRPFVEHEFDAATIRGLARLVCGTTCPGIGIVENLVNYIVGNGFTFKAVPKAKDVRDDGLCAAVNDLIEAICEVNEFHGDLDRELFTRSRRDGESIVSLHPDHSGVTTFREIEPDQLKEAGGTFSDDFIQSRGVMPPMESSFSFGIHTPANDVQKVLGYCVHWESDDQPDYLPAKFVWHQKVNVDRNIKRGVSDFYPAWQWLKQQERLLRNTGEGAAEQAAIAYIIQYATAQQSQVTAMVTEKATHQWTSTGATGNQQTHYKQQRDPGTQLNVPKGQEYQPGPMGAERGQAFLEVVQGILRQVATRWSMTEGMISGDDSNNNLASLTEAGSRFVNYAQTSQFRQGTAYVKLLWQCIYLAWERGYFRRFNLSWAEIKQRIKITFEGADIVQRKAIEQEEVRSIRFQNGIISREQWQREAGYDPEEQDEQGAAVQAQPGPGGQLPGGGGQDSPGSDDPGGNSPPAGPSAPSGEYLGLSRLDWKRARAGIKEIQDEVSAGTMKEATARVLLASLGLSAAGVDSLLQDAGPNKPEAPLPTVESVVLRAEIAQPPVRESLSSWLDRAAQAAGIITD